MKIKKLALLSLVSTLIFTMVSCGSAKTEGNGAAGTSSKDKKTVVCALDSNVSPFTYYDENGNIAGYDYETLKLIADMLKDDYNFEYQIVDYDAAAIGLESGQYDLEAGTKYKTSARAEKFLITDPNYYAAVTLAVSKDSGIKSVEDMKGKTLVPVPEADGLRQVYLDYTKAHPEANITQETGSSLVSIADGLNYVASGRYDAMMDAPDMFNDVLKQDKDLAEKITVIQDPFTVVGGHFLVNKDREDLYNKINGALKELKENGKLGELSKKWFGEDLIEKYGSMALD